MPTIVEVEGEIKTSALLRDPSARLPLERRREAHEVFIAAARQSISEGDRRWSIEYLARAVAVRIEMIMRKQLATAARMKRAEGSALSELMAKFHADS